MCTSHPASRPRGGRPRLAAIALGCAALVAGCAVGPDFIAPARPAVDAYVPDGAARTRFAASDATQTLAPDAPFPDAWWRLFGSREIDAAVDDAFAGSPTLARARATLARSEHALIAGAGVFYPQADAQAGASRQRYVPLRTGANLPASLFNLFTLSTTVSYALDLWGGERRHVEGLAAQADAQRHALAAARLTLAANVVNTMIARAAYADEIALTRELIALTDEQIRLTRAQVSAGTSAYTAVLALQAARASLDASLPALEQKTGEADDLLATLAGRYPAEHVPPQVSLAAIALPARLPRTVPSELVRRRPTSCRRRRCCMRRARTSAWRARRCFRASRYRRRAASTRRARARCSARRAGRGASAHRSPRRSFMAARSGISARPRSTRSTNRTPRIGKRC